MNITAIFRPFDVGGEVLWAWHRKAVSYAPLRAALPQFGCAPFRGGDGVYHRANVSSWELIYRTTE